MKCEHCGIALTPEDLFCTNCGVPRNQNTTPNEQIQYVQPQVQYVQAPGEKVYTKEDDKMANQLCIYSLLLQYVAPLVIGVIAGVFSVIAEELGYVVSSVSLLCPLAAFVLMVVARVKYPQNRFAKILMWIYIVTIGLSLLIFIFIVAACVMCAVSLS